MNVPTYVRVEDFDLKPGNHTLPAAKRCRVSCEIDIEKIMRWYGARALGNKSRRTKQLSGWVRITVREVTPC